MKIWFNTRFIAGRDLYQTHFIGKIQVTANTGYPATVHEALDPKFSGYSPKTDSSKAVLLLWFLICTCSSCPYLYFGSPVMLVTYFSKFYVAE